jgi:hypothetical protein
MAMPQVILLIINVLGGIAVIGSYVLGLHSQSGGASVLWGNVPQNARTVYAISMVLSALGYFAFIYYLLFRIVPSEVSIAGKFGFSLFYIIFLVMLIASAFWMPLTNLYVGHPGMGVWVGVRVVLALVGLAAIALFCSLLTLHGKTPGVFYWLAVTGAGYFAFHTAILDAIVWAALFR